MQTTIDQGVQTETPSHGDLTPVAAHGPDEVAGLAVLEEARLPRLPADPLEHCFQGMQSALRRELRSTASSDVAGFPLAARYVDAHSDWFTSVACHALSFLFHVPEQQLFPHQFDRVIAEVRLGRGSRQGFEPLPPHGVLYVANVHETLGYPVAADAFFDAAHLRFCPPLARPGMFANLLAIGRGHVIPSLREKGYVLIPHGTDGDALLTELAGAYAYRNAREQMAPVPITREQLCVHDGWSSMHAAPAEPSPSSQPWLTGAQLMQMMQWPPPERREL